MRDDERGGWTWNGGENDWHVLNGLARDGSQNRDLSCLMSTRPWLFVLIHVLLGGGTLESRRWFALAWVFSPHCGNYDAEEVSASCDFHCSGLCLFTEKIFMSRYHIAHNLLICFSFCFSPIISHKTHEFQYSSSTSRASCSKCCGT